MYHCALRKLSRSQVAGVCLLLLLAGSHRQAGAAEPGRHTAITIYNNDVALVQDTRQMNVAAGRQRLEFPGVSAQIKPETVSLQADDLTVIEQNFDFDLLTPRKMMEKAVGGTVRIVRTNPATGREVTETAQVLAANEGVVLRIGERIEVLRDDGLPVRVLFDRIPANLRARPTLSVLASSTAAGARSVSLRYLTGGLSWRADYVGLYDEQNSRLALQGWVTLGNQSGVSYDNVRTQLIAGSPGDTSESPRRRGEMQGGIVSAGTGGQDASGFADFHIYALPEATTIAENQVKQVSFIDAPNVQAKKLYVVNARGYGSSPTARGAQVALRFQNSAASGLGRALPKGVLRLYARDSQGKSQFIGEDTIEHTPEGSDLRVKIGAAFDVTWRPTLESSDTGILNTLTSRMRYEFRNARNTAVTLLFRQDAGNAENKLLEASLPAEHPDATGYEWTVAIPANGAVTLTFAIREG